MINAKTTRPTDLNRMPFFLPIQRFSPFLCTASTDHHFLTVFKDLSEFSRRIFQNSRAIHGQIALFKNSRSLPGPRSNSRTFPGLCIPCRLVIPELLIRGGIVELFLISQ